MGNIVAVRHGETAWSLSGQHTGVTDVPLTENGRAQAIEIGLALGARQFQTVLCSPRMRARDTAELAGMSGVRTDQRLAEWDYGGYEGRTTAEISAQRGSAWSIWADGVTAGDTPGETIQQVAARVSDLLGSLRPVLRAGDVLLVAHGHVLRVLTACWLGLAPEAGSLFALSAAGVSVLGHERDIPALVLWNAPAAAFPNGLGR